MVYSMSQDLFSEVSIIQTFQPLLGEVELSSLEVNPEWASLKFEHLLKYFDPNHDEDPMGIKEGMSIGLVINNVQYLLVETVYDLIQSGMNTLYVLPDIQGECFPPVPVLLSKESSVINLNCPRSGTVLFRAGEKYDIDVLFKDYDYEVCEIVFELNELELERSRLSAVLPKAESKSTLRL